MMEGTFGSRDFVARALDAELQGAVVIDFACRDLVGRCQRQRDLLRRKHLE
jgi:hypothetical protein